MQYLVLQRFEGLIGKDRVLFEPGDTVNDLHYDIDLLRSSGAALIVYKADSMAEAVENFRSALQVEYRLESIYPYLYSLGLVGGRALVRAKALGQAVGNHSLTGLTDRFVAKNIYINTAARSWSLTVYSSSDYVSDPLFVVQRRAGNMTIHWDTPYEDLDGNASFHYNFTDHLGVNTHDILLLGVSLV